MVSVIRMVLLFELCRSRHRPRRRPVSRNFLDCHDITIRLVLLTPSYKA